MSAAPGWYPDDSGTIRYWDGGQWTEHTQPAAAPAVPDAVQYEAPQYEAPAAPQYEAPAALQYEAPAAPEYEAPAAPQYVAPQAEVQAYENPQYAAPQYVQQPVYQQAYPQQIVGTGAANGVATAGFVVGLVAVFLPLFFGFGAGVTGLVLSIVGVSKSRITGTGKGLAIAGIVLSAVAIVFIL